MNNKKTILMLELHILKGLRIILYYKGIKKWKWSISTSLFYNKKFNLRHFYNNYNLNYIIIKQLLKNVRKIIAI